MPQQQSQMKPTAVLTVVEAAELLRVSERTLWKLANENKIPNRRVGAQYRFVRSQILDWIREGDSA